MSEGNPDTLEIEIDPHALDYFKKSGDVFVLTDVQNPQYSYCRIKGFDADLRIKFEEFIEFCIAYPEPAPNVDSSKPDLVINVFKADSPLNSLPSNLGFYVGRSGFPTVEEWLKTLKHEEIPECSTGRKKTYYLYHIQTV